MPRHCCKSSLNFCDIHSLRGLSSCETLLFFTSEWSPRLLVLERLLRGDRPHGLQDSSGASPAHRLLRPEGPRRPREAPCMSDSSRARTQAGSGSSVLSSVQHLFGPETDSVRRRQLSVTVPVQSVYLFLRQVVERVWVQHEFRPQRDRLCRV